MRWAITFSRMEALGHDRDRRLVLQRESGPSATVLEETRPGKQGQREQIKNSLSSDGVRRSVTMSVLSVKLERNCVGTDRVPIQARRSIDQSPFAAILVPKVTKGPIRAELIRLPSRDFASATVAYETIRHPPPGL